MSLNRITTSDQMPQDLFAIPIHGDQIETTFSTIKKEKIIDSFDYNEDAIQLLRDVQSRADWDDKNYKNIYMHNVWVQLPPYSWAAHEQVLRELGKYDPKGSKHQAATLDDFIQISENRCFTTISNMLNTSHGQLDNLHIGQILYILGTHLHRIEDFKHRQGNAYKTENDPITSLRHVVFFWNQGLSDIHPSDNMANEAITRSIDFMIHFDEFLKNTVPEYRDELYQSFAKFEYDRSDTKNNLKAHQKNALVYRPQNWSELVPQYERKYEKGKKEKNLYSNN